MMKVCVQRIGAGVALLAVVIAARFIVTAKALSMQESRTSQSRVLLSPELPQLDGAHLKSTMVEVTYPPGGANATHRHPCPVVGYVLEGALRMQVKGKPEVTYRAGDSFYEAPTDVHLISANASQEQPARFLAYFVCDHPTPLSVPVTDAPARGR